MSWTEAWQLTITVLASLGGGGAIILGLSSWIGKIWANHFHEKTKHEFAQELENHKNTLQKELEAHKSALQTQLQKELVRFSRLHEQQADVIRELYSRLVDLQNAASTFVRYSQSVTDSQNKEHVQHLWNTADVFKNYFQKHRIYFTQELCCRIEHLYNTLDEACSPLVGFVQNQEVATVAFEDREREWDKAMRTVQDEIGEVPKIKTALEQTFREILGVPQPSKVT